jgi:hypothetical protein
LGSKQTLAGEGNTPVFLLSRLYLGHPDSKKTRPTTNVDPAIAIVGGRHQGHGGGWKIPGYVDRVGRYTQWAPERAPTPRLDSRGLTTLGPPCHSRAKPRQTIHFGAWLLSSSSNKSPRTGPDRNGLEPGSCRQLDGNTPGWTELMLGARGKSDGLRVRCLLRFFLRLGSEN